MNILQSTDRSFVLLSAGWAAGKARDLLGRLSVAFVVVRDEGAGEYHVYGAQQAAELLGLGDAGAPVREALALARHAAAARVEAYSGAGDARPGSVVFDDGQLLGVYDPVPPSFTDFGGGFESATRNLTPAAPGRSGPSLVAELPDEVPLGQTVSLLVSLTREDATGPALPVALAVGKQVDVLVQARRGFTVDGPAEGHLTVGDEDEGLPLQFKVKATALGPGRVRVLAFHQGQSLGMITLSPTVTEAGRPAAPPARGQEQPLAPASVRLPDLSLLILEGQDGGKPSLSLWLTAPDATLGFNYKRFGPVPLKVDPLQYFQEFFQDVERLPVGSADEKALAAQKMAARGSHLFTTLIPAPLQDDLWRLRERITSVLIQSEEPWVPWELCRLVGREGGRVVEGPFFCEAFAVTRWLPGIPQQPRLALRNIALVVPADSNLPCAAEERDYVLGLAGGGRKVKRVAARYQDVYQALAEGVYDGWHFTGHGAFRSPDPNRSAMILEDREAFTPEELSGAATNLGLAAPLVFLNACQIGRAGLSLTGIGGWARQFLQAGAGGFVGAYWSVYDRPACDFARAFYGRLLAGTPVGRAAQEARADVKRSGDPTWLAYTVFADPLAAVPAVPG